MRGVILGISAFYHDSAAALLVDGELVACAQEERFTRIKHDASFPRHAARFVLEEGRIGLGDVDEVAFYDKPLLKFERLLETYHAFAPRGLSSFNLAMPVWSRDKVFMRRMLSRELAELGPGSPALRFPEHHLSHAASAFYPSPFQEAAILTVDGVGEWATTFLGHGQGHRITALRENAFPHSLGLLYSAFTQYCGFRVNSGEYKLMGLAPYGDEHAARFRDFERLIREEMIDVRPDGSLLLNLEYFDFPAGLRMCHEERFERLLGLPPRLPESDISQAYMDLALAIQRVTEDVVLRLAKTVRTLTGSSNLVMAGGVALNCVANGLLRRSGLFDEIWIQPAAGDAGGALGAALAAWHIGRDQERTAKPEDSMRGSYLGPRFDERSILAAVRRQNGVCQPCADINEVVRRTAALLAEGAVVGWFQGAMEWGPRALGNRSILADARDPDTQRRLNLKIKFREGFRPFAPVCRAERAAFYFDMRPEDTSPYMLFVHTVRPEHRLPLPDNYRDLPLYERLYRPRSGIPAVTHVDFSARVQTVHPQTNPLFHDLLTAFEELTGCGVIVNTSFNIRGEPIVCTPEDAYRCFMATEMDYLVMGRFILAKGEQPAGNSRIAVPGLD